VTNQDLSGVGGDLFVGDPDADQPDWRSDDPDDDINDNEDPGPIAPGLLAEMLGFDPGDEEEDVDIDEDDIDDDDEQDEDEE
jgi:hypothetical protein